MGEVIRINRITSTVIKIPVEVIETYDTEFHVDDFADDDQINKRAVTEMIDNAVSGAVLPPVRLSYPINTVLPITIDYTPYEAYGNDPEIQVKYKTGQIITSSATINQGDTTVNIATITINAASDGDPTGSGTEHTDGDLIIVIKQ